MAITPTPRHVQATSASEQGRSQHENASRNSRSAAHQKEQEARAKREPDCSKSQSEEDCLVQAWTARATQQQANIAWWSGLVSVLTLAATGLAAGAAIAAVIYSAKSATAASEAAKAATLNVDAIIGAERAQILETIIHQNIQSGIINAVAAGLPRDMDEGHLSNGFQVQFAFKNYGKTLAVLKDYSVQIECLTALPEATAYELSEFSGKHIIDAGDSSETLTIRLTRPITLGMARLISEGRLAIWFYGRVHYGHIFGRKDVEHRFIYCYRGDGFKREYRKNYSSHYNADA